VLLNGKERESLGRNARMHRVQTTELYDREKQKERYSTHRDEKVLPVGQKAYFASRDQVTNADQDTVLETVS
jgi:hypothetical protein